jgi:hypothetical protein
LSDLPRLDPMRRYMGQYAAAVFRLAALLMAP